MLRIRAAEVCLPLCIKQNLSLPTCWFSLSFMRTSLVRKVFLLLQNALFNYPIEENFLQKWAVPLVDSTIFCLDKSLMAAVEMTLFFKDLIKNRLEALLKAPFFLSGPVMQLAAASVTVCQVIAAC